MRSQTVVSFPDVTPMQGSPAEPQTVFLPVLRRFERLKM